MFKKFLLTLLLSLVFTLPMTTTTKAETINRWDIELSEEEIDLLVKIVWLEAGNQEFEGKVAVVETIFNRMYSDLYPNTLEDVLSQKGQFGTWHKRDNAKPTTQCYAVVYSVLSGSTNVLEYDRLYFNNQPIGYNPIQIGGQYFGCQKQKGEDMK